jgi:hypothetical protein
MCTHRDLCVPAEVQIQNQPVLTGAHLKNMRGRELRAIDSSHKVGDRLYHIHLAYDISRVEGEESTEYMYSADSV